MKRGASMPHSQENRKIPIMGQITPIPRIHTYFFGVYFKIVHSTAPKPSQESFTCRFTS